MKKKMINAGAAQTLERARDYLLQFISSRHDSYGYEWRRVDGTVIELRVSVKYPEKPLDLLQSLLEGEEG